MYTYITKSRNWVGLGILGDVTQVPGHWQHSRSERVVSRHKITFARNSSGVPENRMVIPLPETFPGTTLLFLGLRRMWQKAVARRKFTGW